MGFNDILKKSFLEGFVSGTATTKEILVAMILTGIIGLYIFCVYRVVARKSFYSRSFNISLVALAIITSAIIIAVQSSVVISLGMVGALSIVRFRTAVKEPMDLIFLFWSISIGIICGAGLFKVAIIVSVLVSLVILVLELLPNVKAPMLLIINASDFKREENILRVISENTNTYVVKTRTVTKNSFDLICEVKVKKGNSLLKELTELEEVNSVSLMEHDGEVTY